MISKRVQELALQVWELRENSVLKTDAALLGRMIFEAAAADVAANPGYDPTEDDRVDWLLEMVHLMKRHPYRLRPLGAADREMRVSVLLGKWQLVPCGKDRACGES